MNLGDIQCLDTKGVESAKGLLLMVHSMIVLDHYQPSLLSGNESQRSARKLKLLEDAMNLITPQPMRKAPHGFSES